MKYYLIGVIVPEDQAHTIMELLVGEGRVVCDYRQVNEEEREQRGRLEGVVGGGSAGSSQTSEEKEQKDVEKNADFGPGYVAHQLAEVKKNFSPGEINPNRFKRLWTGKSKYVINNAPFTRMGTVYMEWAIKQKTSWTTGNEDLHIRIESEGFSSSSVGATSSLLVKGGWLDRERGESGVWEYSVSEKYIKHMGLDIRSDELAAAIRGQKRGGTE